jgi:zinc protease|uniref:M16 family metallopeptidase n=1 Tax=Cyanobium sp. TaxID=2164130 RepID=UPI0040490CEF
MTAWNQTTLPGGLPLIWQQRPGPDVVAARLWIRGGSSQDPRGHRGAHQLLAGLLTRGCGDLDADALADLVEGRGAVLRSEASEDSLVVSLKCAAADASTLLPLLLTMVREPHLRPEQVDLERQLNLQSLQRQREDPFQLAHDLLREQLYGEGPYGHDPLGVEAELANLDRDVLLPLLGGLGATGALLVLTGAVAPELTQQLGDTLAAAPWSIRAPERTPGPMAKGPGGFGPMEQDTEQLVVMLGSATVPLGHPDALALRVLQAHLGMGMSSRLFVVMREERGLAYDVGVHMPARMGATPFIWHLSSSADRAKEACDCLLEEWQRMVETPLDPAALALAKAKYIGQDAMGRQTCGQIADRQALVLGHGLGANYIEATLALAHHLTPADLLGAAQRWLQQPALSVCGPGEALSSANDAWTSWRI